MSRRSRPPKPTPSASSESDRTAHRAPHTTNPSRFRRFLTLCTPPIGELRERKAAFLWAIASAVLVRLALPTVDAWPLGFVALVPWLWGLRGTTPRGAFWISWVFGTVLFTSLFTWLAVLRVFNPFIFLGIPLLGLFQGFFPAISGAGMVYFARRVSPGAAYGLSILWWCAWEWFRSAGALGLPYALLGHTVAHSLILAQLTSLGGVVLLSALVMAANLSIMEIIACIRRREAHLPAIARAVGAALFLLAAIGWGVMARRGTVGEPPLKLQLALVQTNVTQVDKFAAYADADQAKRTELQDKMTRDLLKQLDALEPGAFDLIVTPEAGLVEPFFDLAPSADLQRELRERANSLRAPIVVGAADNVFRDEATGEWTDDPARGHAENGLLDFETYNALYVIRPGETTHLMRGDYRKIHLMPFGETVPYFDLIPGLQENIVQIGSFLKGSEDQPPVFISVPPPADDPSGDPTQIQIGPTICFEDLFPLLHNRLARRGAQVFVNITNNAWFDPSRGSAYHYEYARLRCIETARPGIFCTNSGVTALVSETGEELARLPLREQGVLAGELAVPRNPGKTLYSRLGDWFGLLAFFGSTIALLVLRRRNLQ